MVLDTSSLQATMTRSVTFSKDITIWLVYSWAELATDVFSFWNNKVWNHITSLDEKDILKHKLDKAPSFQEWEELAYKLDSELGNDIWRQNPVSRKYDYKLISRRYKELVEARENGNFEVLIDRLRSGLLRNLGSIATLQLYNRAYSGTKVLIEDYVNEVIQCLEFIHQHYPANSQMSVQQQLDFFHDTRQSFGNTSLILHGGSLFGLCHIGTVRSLFTHGLLPRIISGSTVGALVAALVCTCRDDELLATLDRVSTEMPGLLKENGYTDVKYDSVAEGVISSLCPPEIVMFEQYIKDKLGDMTFEEAYLKTDRVLNITVTPVSKDADGFAQQIPKLLNYLSAPHVVIWSAASASIGSGVIHKEVTLQAKDHNGNVVPFVDGEMITYQPSNQTIYLTERESPYTRLSELFNVNNFIVSLARPYFAPLLLSDFKHRGYQSWRIRIIKLLRLELQHRLVQSSQLHILPNVVRQWFVDENIPNGFQVTIVPELPSLVHDFGKVFDSHNIKDKVDYWIKVGEKSTWPMMSIIWSRCAIEFALDDLYNKKRASIGI